MTEFYIDGFSALLGDAPAEDFTSYVEARRLRRMETAAKNALLCSCRALVQAGVALQTPKDMGLSVAVGAGALQSTCKFMDSILDDGDELSSPTAFAGSVHNSTGLTLSMALHLNGPCVTTGQFDASFAGALLTARQFLTHRLCSRVLVAAAEDINPVAAAYAPENPSLFKTVLRAPEKPFVRAAAAWVVSAEPTVNTRFAVEHFEFSRTALPNRQEPCEACTAAWAAVKSVRQLEAGKPFMFHDVFGGADLRMEITPYAK